jgi:uncharacterized protein YjbJ (UPF0337 family)
MSEDQIRGAATDGLGHLQDVAGGLVGDDKLQLKGKLNRAKGAAQQAYGKVKGKAAEAKAKADVAYARAKRSARGSVNDLEGRARENPLAAMGAAAAVGLLVGLILGGGLGAYGGREIERRR